MGKYTMPDVIEISLKPYQEIAGAGNALVAKTVNGVGFCVG
jgi:hypothetical protein